MENGAVDSPESMDCLFLSKKLKLYSEQQATRNMKRGIYNKDEVV
jgi:hypothetical protein